MITFVDLQIECRLRNIKLQEAQLQEEKYQLVLWQRQKWWLEHPAIAYFTSHTTWETNYGHSEWKQELYFYVDSVIGLDGSSMDFQNRGWFDKYPILEEEVQDDRKFITYTNPYANI